MQLVGVRSTNPDDGLVAVLVEDGGPAMLAIPVTAHEGLVLHAHDSYRSPSWPRLLDDVVEALGGRIGRTELDVDDDARIVARLVVEVPEREDKVMTVLLHSGRGAPSEWLSPVPSACQQLVDSSQGCRSQR